MESPEGKRIAGYRALGPVWNAHNTSGESEAAEAASPAREHGPSQPVE